MEPMQRAQIQIILAPKDGSEPSATVHVFEDGSLRQDGPDRIVRPLLRKLAAALVEKEKDFSNKEHALFWLKYRSTQARDSERIRILLDEARLLEERLLETSSPETAAIG